MPRKGSRKLVLEQWNGYEAKVIHPDASRDQRRCMRMAFYAGAEALLFRVIAGFAPESEPTADDLQMMNDVHEELQQFALDVKEGRI